MPLSEESVITFLNNYTAVAIICFISFFVVMYLLMDRIVLKNHPAEHKILGVIVIWLGFSTISYFLVIPNVLLALVYAPVMTVLVSFVLGVVAVFILVASFFVSDSDKKPGSDRGSFKERRSFTPRQKRMAVARQRGLCFVCERRVDLNHRHFHHLDGDHSNNSDDNCVMIHANCHGDVSATYRDQDRM